MAGYPDMSRQLAHLSNRYLKTSAEDFVRVAGSVDGVDFVGNAPPSAILFQFARQDEVIEEDVGMRFFDAAREPKEIFWYDAGHAFNNSALCDRASWLAKKLRFQAPNAKRIAEAHLPQRDLEYWQASVPVLRATMKS